MEIKQTKLDNTATLALIGRLDTVTSSKLGDELAQLFKDGPVELVFDFAELEYISSAGLRVLLIAQKQCNAQATSMVIVKANDSVREVFEITGFSNILTVQ
jgi:anti-sigma B factor antagonist